MNRKLSDGYYYLVKETFHFIEENFEGIVPAGRIDQNIYFWTKDIYIKAEQLLAGGQKEEMETLLENYLEYSLQYFKYNTPWQTLENDRRACCNIILNTVQMVANLSILLDALHYESAGKVVDWLQLDRTRQFHSVRSGFEIPEMTL